MPYIHMKKLWIMPFSTQDDTIYVAYIVTGS